MVFYASVPENNELVQKAKEEFRNGIIVPRSKVENYVEESDCILIGPGLSRKEGQEKGDDDTKELTTKLLSKFPEKKWVIDGGSLQVISPEDLPKTAIVTPHKIEFEKLFGKKPTDENVEHVAKTFGIIVLIKGEYDIIASENKIIKVTGGNAGMTKGGTGAVLAGLVSSLYCKNEASLSASAASYINKKAGEDLSEKMGIYFNASDLTNAIPEVMNQLL